MGFTKQEAKAAIMAPDSGVHDSEKAALLRFTESLEDNALASSLVNAADGNSLIADYLKDAKKAHAAQGQGTSTSGAVAIREVLAAAPRAICIEGTQNTTKKPIYSGFTVKLWGLREDKQAQQNLMGIVQEKVKMRTMAANPIPTGSLHLSYGSEALTNAEFDIQVLRVLNEVHNALGDGRTWKAGDRSQVTDGSIPDFTHTRVSNGTDIMTIEGKFYPVIPYRNLFAAHSTKNVKRSVDQACGYMKHRGHTFGGLTTYNVFSPILRISEDCFAVSNGFWIQDTKPSFAELIFALSELQVAEMAKHNGPWQPPDQALLELLGMRPSSPANAPRGPAPTQNVRRSLRLQGTGAASATPFPAQNASTGHCGARLEYGTIIGHGMCGNVWLARLAGREVAVKAVDPCNSSGLVEVLAHEAAMYNGPLSGLQGRVIPTLVFHGPCETAMCLITSFVRGVHPNSSSSAKALESAEKGLRAIHAQGVLHGDIRMENILLDGDRAWWLDFGESSQTTSKELAEEELDALRALFGQQLGSPGSDKSIFMLD